jgi:hypothetical protein
MSSVKCRICRETWNLWGANHGDMAGWELDLFKKGAGCPCCKGVLDEGEEDHLEDHLHSVVFDGCEDPDSFEMLHELNPDKKIPWIEPEPQVAWECAGCGMKVCWNNERPYDGDKLSEDEVWLYWKGKDSYRINDKPSLETDYIIKEKKYCPNCATTCAECGKTVFIEYELHVDDAYDEGASWSHPGNPMWGSVCLTCLEELEARYDEDSEEKSNNNEEER